MQTLLWPNQLHAIYDKAVELYRSGKRGDDTYFNEDETSFLASIGLRPIHLYDYAEDFNRRGEPDWDLALLVLAARRDYFLFEMKSANADYEVSSEELPPKTAALDGVVWLPRILAKARCFLGGGLCHDIMYGCAGDMKFFNDHNLHPADFLRAVWGARGDDQKILEFVSSNKTS